MKAKYPSSRKGLESENKALKKEIHSQALKIKRLEDALREERTEIYNSLSLVTDEKVNFYKSQLEQFTYIVTHDLQEPIRTMKNFSDLLVRKHKENLEADALTYFDYIVGSSNRISKLMNGLLEYTRIGRYAKFEKTNCNNSLINAQNSLGLLVENPDVTIQKDVLPILNAYRKEFKILLVNLLENALKFRKPNEQLKISITASKKDNYWQFAISDNGIGIRENKLEDIFIIFRQLHSRNKYDGIGMGLAHCRKIVELHEGKIWATSELDVGSTFYFTIPILERGN